MSPVLEPFGIDADAEALYRRVLRQDGLGLQAHALALGWPMERLRAAMEPLQAARLVRLTFHDTLLAPHPRKTLTRLVERESLQLDLRRRELEDVAVAVNDFAADHRAGRIDGVTAAALEGLAPSELDVVPAEALPSVVEELITTTTGPIRSLHRAVAAGPATDRGVEDAAREALAGGRELRSVYPLAVIDQPEHLAWVRSWAELGEQQRVVETVPAEFAVLGEDAVIAAPIWGTSATTAVVIRMPLIVSVFTAVFDEAWTGGLPVPDERVEQDAETRLLALLASGFKDEAIARYLGLGVRTVRRRVASLMDDLSVHTRFQLGVVAERRGLLGRRS
jgi:DNA-binding CsgD family transcriptional regulator